MTRDDAGQPAEPAHGPATLEAWAWVARARAAARSVVEPGEPAAEDGAHEGADGAEVAPG